MQVDVIAHDCWKVLWIYMGQYTMLASFGLNWVLIFWEMLTAEDLNNFMGLDSDDERSIDVRDDIRGRN